MVSTGLEMLSSPFKVGKVTLRNRLVYPPFETNYAVEGFASAKHIDLNRRIAAGGVGLIVLEASNVNPDIKPTIYGLEISHDRYMPELRKLVDAVHKEGVSIIIQIVDKAVIMEGVSIGDWTKADILKLERYFVDAIVRAEQCGFDGIELHAAHLYTLADFLSRDGNKRKDEYGRSLEGRARIIKEIYEAAKPKVSPDLLITCRYDGDEFMVGGSTLKDGMAVGAYLEGLGFDMLSISAGGRVEPIYKTGHYAGFDRSYAGSRSCPGPQYPDAANIHLPEGVKRAVKRIPVIGCGKIGTAQLAEQVLRENRVDLVGMGRAIFCDPELPKKSFAGRANEVLKCTWCNVCLKLYMADRETVCQRQPGVQIDPKFLK